MICHLPLQRYVVYQRDFCVVYITEYVLCMCTCGIFDRDVLECDKMRFYLYIIILLMTNRSNSCV